MRPIPARHILAVAQAGLFVALMVIGQAQYDSELARREIARINKPQVEKVSGTVVGWHFPPPVPLTTQIAMGLNAPAAPPGLLIYLLIIYLLTGYKSKLLLTGCCAVFVLILWYLIGREIDRRRDLLPLKAVSPPGRFTPAIVALGFLLCVVLAAVSLRSFVLGRHHEGEYYALFFGFWLGLGAYVLWRKLRRWRSPGNTPSELRITS